MVNRRGRPRIDDEAALRQVAEYVVGVEEKGTQCSIRAAILRTSDRVTGNSSDAMLWRLQRKWRRDGPGLLAEARKRRTKRRHPVRLPMLGGLAGSAVEEMMRGSRTVDEVMRALRFQEEEMMRGSRTVDEVMRAVRLQEEAMMRGSRTVDEVMRAMRFQEEEMMRGSRTVEEAIRAIRGW